MNGLEEDGVDALVIVGRLVCCYAVVRGLQNIVGLKGSLITRPNLEYDLLHI